MADESVTPDWQTDDGSIRLYRADCLEVLPAIEGVEMVITDPPYFQPATHYCPTRDQGAPKKSIGDMSVLELAFKIWCDRIAAIVGTQGTVYFFCDGQSYPIAFTALYPHAKYVRPLIWDKVVSYNGYTWRHQHELIAWAEMENAVRVPTGDGDILRFRGVEQADRFHPAEKPVELIKTLIEKHSYETVADPFMGSGTTGVACVKTGRKFIGIEIDDGYFQIAVKRIKRALAEQKEMLFPVVERQELLPMAV